MIFDRPGFRRHVAFLSAVPLMALALCVAPALAEPPAGLLDVSFSQTGTATAGDVLEFQVEYSDAGPSRFTGGDNVGPKANAGGARRTRVAAPVAFDGSASFDIDGAITSYRWDFGDGAATTGSISFSSHAYAAVGIYSVTLTVTDDHHAVDTDTVKVTVYAEPLTAGVTEAASVGSDGALALDDGTGVAHPSSWRPSRW